MKSFLSLLFITTIILFCKSSIQAQSLTCFDAYLSPICDTIGPYPSYTIPWNGATAPQGPLYGSVSMGMIPPPTANPKYFTISVSQPGPVHLVIKNQNLSNIGFSLWGPFASFSKAQLACDSLGHGGKFGTLYNSISTNAPQEYVNISYVWPGQVYVLMVSASGVPTDITIHKVMGTGELTCVTGQGDAVIEGDIYEDLDLDCNYDAFERGINKKLVKILPQDYYTMTDTNGHYKFHHLGIDTYTVEIDLDTFLWNLNCPNSLSQQVNISSTTDTVLGVDFALGINNYCSDLHVDVAMPFIRPCGIGTNFMFVNYCNSPNATMGQDSVFVTIRMDTFLTAVASSIPWIAQNGSEYTFYVGALDPGECGSFYLICVADCGLLAGTTICYEAEIAPHDTCYQHIIQSLPNTNPSCIGSWDQSELSVEGFCLNDSLISFVVQNIAASGLGDMSCYQKVRVFQNEHLYLEDSIMLNGGDSIVLNIPSDGYTWRMDVDQHPLYPGISKSTALVEQCGDSALVAMNWESGLMNNFPSNDAHPNLDVDCTPITASYDPNDKRGFPLGLTEDHIIQPNTDLEYMIRFQNTGTDTAFTVIIRDTLPPTLDIQSLEIGASSHNYNFNISGPRVLEWTFNNIMLPDSNINEPLSHGFISFKVKQMPNLPNGTYIHNEAAIYFDVNAPVITNLSEHLVDDSAPVWIITEMDPIQSASSADWDVQIFPNPTNQWIHIRSEQVIKQVRLIGLQGQVIQQQQANRPQVSLDVSGLPQSVYLLELSSERGFILRKVVKSR